MKPPTSAARRHLRPDRLFFSAAVAVMLASVGRVPSVESSSLLLFFFRHPSPSFLSSSCHGSSRWNAEMLPPMVPCWGPLLTSGAHTFRKRRCFIFCSLADPAATLASIHCDANDARRLRGVLFCFTLAWTVFFPTQFLRVLSVFVELY